MCVHLEQNKKKNTQILKKANICGLEHALIAKNRKNKKKSKILCTTTYVVVSVCISKIQ